MPTLISLIAYRGKKLFVLCINTRSATVKINVHFNNHLVELLSTFFVHFVIKHETWYIVCMYHRGHFKNENHLRFDLFDLQRSI